MVEALERTEEDKLFKFGAGYVQIKGGKRKTSAGTSANSRQSQQLTSRQRRLYRRADEAVGLKEGSRSQLRSRWTKEADRFHYKDRTRQYKHRYSREHHDEKRDRRREEEEVEEREKQRQQLGERQQQQQMNQQRAAEQRKGQRAGEERGDWRDRRDDRRDSSSRRFGGRY